MKLVTCNGSEDERILLNCDGKLAGVIEASCPELARDFVDALGSVERGSVDSWRRVFSNYARKWSPNSSKPYPRLNISQVEWEYEDHLPEMEDSEFEALFKASRVDVVRMYPFVEDSNGNRIWITQP